MPICAPAPANFWAGSMTPLQQAALNIEVRRCEALLARPFRLGALGRLLTWRSRARAHRALKKAKTAFDVMNWARREGFKKDQQIDQVVEGFKVDLREFEGK